MSGLHHDPAPHDEVGCGLAVFVTLLVAAAMAGAGYAMVVLHFASDAGAMR